MSAAAPSQSRDGKVRWWDLLIAFFGGNALGLLLVAIGVLALLIASVRPGHPIDVKAILKLLETDFWSNQAILIASDAGFVAVIWLVARQRFQRPLNHYLSSTGMGTVLAAVASGVALSLALNGVNIWLERSGLVTFRETQMERLLEPRGALQLAATLPVVSLFAPFVEEFFFRGLFLEWARRMIGVGLAVVTTALVFAIVHGHFLIETGVQPWLYTFELFLAGLVLAAWAIRTGSLRAAWATHAAYNATATILAVFVS